MKKFTSVFMLILVLIFTVSCEASIDVSSGTSNTAPAATTAKTVQTAAQTTAQTTAASTTVQTTLQTTVSTALQTTVQTSVETTFTTKNTSATTNASTTPTRDVGESFPPAEGKVVAFTFDDGPAYSSGGSNSTSKILDKLEELGMKATFFVVGDRVGASSSELLNRMVALGCDIGNHSYDHPNYNTMTLDDVRAQINKTNTLIEEQTGKKTTLLRPPYGNLKKDYAAEIGMTVVCWGVDTLDWQLRDTQKVYDYALPQISSGDIILMHDIYSTTAEAFCMLADKLVADGYRLVTVSELLGSAKLASTTTFYGFQN